jgi:radical SAM superfamily enzyme YgiQ (UPF0313 family)
MSYELIKMSLDILFIHPNAAEAIYQDLGKKYSAIEPPIWAGMLANHCLTKGFSAQVLDTEALRLTDAQAVDQISRPEPRLVAFVIYGQQPSASTQNMEGAIRLARKVKKEHPSLKILFVGAHVAALPEEVLKRHDCVDFVCQNEGVYTISNLLRTDLKENIDKVKGLGFRIEGKIVLNSPSPIVAQENLEKDLPGVAWELLPMEKYRTALWHAMPNKCERQPFAAIYTSLGCPMRCSFCMINIINRQTNEYADGSAVFRYWDPEFIIKDFDYFARKGIRNIKIADELFVYRPQHFLKLCELIIERGYDFNIWCYARVDMIKPEYLAVLKDAGVNYLALGIESGNKRVRKDVTKGRFEETDIRETVGLIRSYKINVAANYIFGLPEDDRESMQETLDLAMELNTEMANFYCAMAYPGSPLYGQAKQEGWPLPDSYAGYSQHAYEAYPLPTRYLSAKEVLAFRDEAWIKYHTNLKFLKLLKEKFGQAAVDETLHSTKIKLKRKLLVPSSSEV